MTSLKLVQTWIAVLLVSLLWVVGCDSGSNTDTPDPNAVRPSISGLSAAAADIGDAVVISGMNFGDVQQGGSARLNGVDFAVTTWSDTQITVTVNAGMSSGIVVVSRDGLDSLSGPEAQLYIPTAPAGTPTINVLSPDYGVVGADEILISGTGFGSTQGSSKVWFTGETGGAVSAIGLVEANVVSIPIGGTETPQWTASSVRVWVPATAVSGPVYVEVSGTMSNGKAFTAQPPVEPLDPPSIITVDPLNGPVGALVTINGDNFGNTQGGSTLTLGNPGKAMDVISWSNSEITATVPVGAESGVIRVTVGGMFDESDIFIVANTPVITGWTNPLRIGKSVTITGQNFGATQATNGKLKIGSTFVTPTTWNNTLITVTTLPAINYDNQEAIDIVVTADNGLSSAPVLTRLQSSLSGVVFVTPAAGQRNSGASAHDGTTFAFNVTVFGGDGPYEYTLDPNISKANDDAPMTTNPTILYQYPFDASAQPEETLETRVRVRDTSTGDAAVISGPDVKVVNAGVPVIISIETADYNRAADAPNDFCYLPSDGSYHDLTFLGGQMSLTSSKGDIFDQGNPVQSFTRNHQAFLSGGASPRPYGYRYKGQTGSKVVVRGLNFGASVGELWLNASDAVNTTQVTGIPAPDWTDTAVTFTIPQDLPKQLSGFIKIVPSGSGSAAVSVVPLICSPYINNVLPGTVPLDGDLTLTGFDIQPPQQAGISGPETYMFWIVRANYQDPFGAGATSGLVQLVTPIPPDAIPNPNTITFNMGNLGTTYPLLIEVFNAAGTQSQIITADSLVNNTNYIMFLWTGVLEAGTASSSTIANSGVFSEQYTVQVGAGAPGGQDPVAALTATPDNGGAPLIVDLDASGSTDADGTIVKYEWDYTDDGTYDADTGATATSQFVYGATGTCRVRVTDNDGNTDTATATITVTGPPGP
jgi:hypothetical protein